LRPLAVRISASSGSARGKRGADQAVEQARADDRVPGVLVVAAEVGLARVDLVEVEADDLLAALGELLEPEQGLGPAEAARDRRARVGAEGGLEAVDVERDV